MLGPIERVGGIRLLGWGLEFDGIGRFAVRRNRRRRPSFQRFGATLRWRAATGNQRCYDQHY